MRPLRLLSPLAALVLLGARHAAHADDIDLDDDWDDAYDDDDDYAGGESKLYRNPAGGGAQPPSPPPPAGYRLDDPTANHRNEGIRRDGEGDWKGAVESFQAACTHNPRDAGAFNDLGVANMRVALKGIEVEKHLMASRAAYEMSAEIAGTTDENLQRNLDALKDVEEWGCTQLQICLGSQAKGGKGAAAAGGGAATAPGIDGAKKAAMAEMAGLDGGAGAEQLRNFIKVQVDAALGKLAQTVATNKMDFDILDSSMSKQIKALKSRVKTLEETIAKLKAGGGISAAQETEMDEEDEEADEPVDEKDEM